MMRRIFSLVLLFSPLLVPGSVDAQWGRHFSVAAGPAIGIDGTPPDAGAHFHGAAALAPGPRTLNLIADTYVSWMAPGTREEFFPDGSFSFATKKTSSGSA